MTKQLYIGPDGAPADKPGWPVTEETRRAWERAGFSPTPAPYLPQRAPPGEETAFSVAYDPQMDRLWVWEQGRGAELTVDFRFPLATIRATTPRLAALGYINRYGPKAPPPAAIRVMVGEEKNYHLVGGEGYEKDDE